jgi:hypothetical protein
LAYFPLSETGYRFACIRAGRNGAYVLQAGSQELQNYALPSRKKTALLLIPMSVGFNSNAFIA